jgi:integrase
MNKTGKRTRENGEGGLIKIYRKEIDSEGNRIEASPFWYMVWRVAGRQRKKSTGTTVKQEALAQLRARIEKAKQGFQTADPSKITYEYLRELFMNDYRENEYSSLLTNKETGVEYVCGLDHLDNFFEGRKASEITVESIDRFKRDRRQAGASNGTINRSLAKLRRMFKLAAKRGKLQYIPAIDMLPEPKGRQGFLEVADYDKLYSALPEHVRPMLAVGFYTGMRFSEILNLKWFQVNVADGKITLEAEDTKTEEPRIIPMIDGLPELFNGLREKNPDAEYVFLRKGERIKTIIKAWRNACVRAGIRVKINGVETTSHFEKDGTYRGFLFHDLRRSAVRNFIRAGVPRSVAMKISGHKTEEVFERYNITSEEDLQDAAVQVGEFLKKKAAAVKATVNAKPSSDTNFDATLGASK